MMQFSRQVKTAQINQVNQAPVETMTLFEHALPNSVRYILLKFPGTILAGGSIISMLNNLPVNDWDIFVNDMDVITQIMDQYVLQPDGNGNAFILRTMMNVNNKIIFQEFILYGHKIQLIYRPWQEPQDVYEDFDIRACMQAVYFDKTPGGAPLKSSNLKYIAAHGAVHDATAKQINLMHIKPNVLATIRRIHKYEERGWTIQNQQWIKLLEYIRTNHSKIIDNAVLKSNKDSDYNNVLPAAVIAKTGQSFSVLTQQSVVQSGIAQPCSIELKDEDETENQEEPADY